jgi:hypothetical protein
MSFESSFRSDVYPGSRAFLIPGFGIRIQDGKNPDPRIEIRNRDKHLGSDFRGLKKNFG